MTARCGLSPSIVENMPFTAFSNLFNDASLAQEVHFQTGRHLFIQKVHMEHTCSLPWMMLIQSEREL